MTLVFGQSTSSFSSYAAGTTEAQEFTSRINELVLYFVYLFVGRFVLGYVGTLCACVAAARTTRAIRRAFLSATLRQEVGYFDQSGNGSPATQVTTSESSSSQTLPGSLADDDLQMATVSTKALLRKFTSACRALGFSSPPISSRLPCSGSSLSSPCL